MGRIGRSSSLIIFPSRPVAEKRDSGKFCARSSKSISMTTEVGMSA